MGNKLILHIGPHKTGTTTLQHFFSINRRVLAANGILYPFSEDSHWRMAANIGLKMWPWPYDELAPTWNELKKLSDENPEKKLLLSSESFSHAAEFSKKKAAHQFFQKLRLLGRHIHVIIYLRRQDLWLESFYIECLKHFGKAGIDEFNESKKECLDYYKTISFWENNVGKGNITLRIFEKEQLPDIRSDFLKILGIDGFSGFQLNEDLNCRQNLFQVKVLKNHVEAFHTFFPNPEEGFNKPYSELNRVLGRHLFAMSKWPSKKEYRVLPYSTAQKITEKYDESNRKVANEFLGREALFMENLSPYEHDDLDFKEILKGRQREVVLALWEDTCRVMGQINLPIPMFLKT